MNLIFFLLFFLARAEEPDYQVVQIYVDITEVHTPDGQKGTSVPLNVIVAEQAQHTSTIENRMHRHAAPDIWRGEINVYDWNNVQYMPTFKQCNYLNAIKCGIQNKHWTLRTVVTVGEKYSVFTSYLYDETGKVLASSSKTNWGKIRWKPQWKLTVIKEQGPFGGGTKQIFEQWPPKMEEIPPLITPMTVSQASFGFYWVGKKACKIKACRK